MLEFYRNNNNNMLPKRLNNNKYLVVSQSSRSNANRRKNHQLTAMAEPAKSPKKGEQRRSLSRTKLIDELAKNYERDGSEESPPPVRSGEKKKRRMSHTVREAKKFYEGEVPSSRASRASRVSNVKRKSKEENETQDPPGSDPPHETPVDKEPEMEVEAPAEPEEQETPEVAPEADAKTTEEAVEDKTEDGMEDSKPTESEPDAAAAEKPEEKVADESAPAEEATKVEEEKSAAQEEEKVEEMASPMLTSQTSQLVEVVERKIVMVERAPFGLTASNLLVIRVWGEADKQGVKIGDKIRKVNNHEVSTNREMKELFADSPIPFPMEMEVGTEKSIAKAKEVLGRLEKQEQEQLERDRLLSRRNSEARSEMKSITDQYKGLPDLSGKVLKKSKLGRAGTRYLKLHNRCIFYAHDEKAIDTKETLDALEKEYRTNLADKGGVKKKIKGKNVVVIPLDNISSVQKSPSGHGITLVVNEGKASRKYTFEAEKGKASLYETWSEAIMKHRG